ncbi:HpcH/HpaI aldolase/citrate lyase family protein [Streptomyces sp. CA-100214]
MRVSRSQIEEARSFLFVPGDRPDRFAKAASSGADLIIIDLEDAVSAANKELARQNAAEWLDADHPAVIRTNPLDAREADEDLEMAARHGVPVMVPKSRDANALTDLFCRVGQWCPVIALIETAAGVEAAGEVCESPGVVRVAFGNVDLSTELCVSPDDQTALLHARSKIVLAAASRGLCPPIDGVTTAVGNAEVLRADIAHARRLGYTGKLCIHPTQVIPVNTQFVPTESEQRWARSVLTSEQSAALVDGHMVDKPVLERARRILRAVEDSVQGGPASSQ